MEKCIICREIRDDIIWFNNSHHDCYKKLSKKSGKITVDRKIFCDYSGVTDFFKEIFYGRFEDGWEGEIFALTLWQNGLIYFNPCKTKNLKNRVKNSFIANLLQIEGVERIMIMIKSLCIGKKSSANWDKIISQVFPLIEKEVLYYCDYKITY